MRLLPMLLLTSSLALFAAPAAWGQQVLQEWDGKGAPAAVSISLPGLDGATQARLRGLNRYALVFGNAAYPGSPLPKSTQDAASMAALLRSLGFKVYGGVNLTKEEMDRQMQAFTKMVEPVKGATVLWYFSGHGMQIEGITYLLPVDIPTGGDELTIRHHGYSLDYAVARLNAIDGQRLIFLDACRTNPYVMGFMSPYVPSLARPSNTRPNTLVSFSTGAGTPAKVGPDNERHSLYTQRLFAALQAAPRSSMVEILEQAASQVRDANDQQIPEVSITLGGRPPFYPIPPICEPAEAEQGWAEAERLGTVEGYRAFASRCADSVYVSLATGKADLLEQRQTLRPQVALGATPVVSPPQQTALLPPPASSVTGSGVPSGIEMVSGRWGEAGSVFRDRSIGIDMVLLPPGSFMMGSPRTDKDRYNDEGPYHEVKIEHAFAVGKTEVTIGQYRRFVEATGRKHEGGCDWRSPGFAQGDNHPVVCVSWEDAKAYVSWLNSQVGSGVRTVSGGVSKGPYRLLTEAEFEYAARGVTSTSAPYRKYWWGDVYDSDYVNGDVKNGKDQYDYTSPVGSFPLSPFGLSDILGNAWEWVADCWADSYNTTPPDGSARPSTDKCDRILRGASWKDNPRYIRAAVRDRGPFVIRLDYIGFRVARTIIS